jgi:nucleotide-binding universal stress UspA family protein
MNRILVPIDFSENAEHVLAAAKIVAEKGTTELLILHAYEPYIADVNLTPGGIMPAVGGSDFLTMTTELEGEFQKRLESYAQTLNSEGYLAKPLWILGSVSNAVEEAIETHNPDLIVIGRTGTGGFFDKLIGSSATSIGLHAKCPVLVVPPQANPASFSKIVYATQFEYEETDILRHVMLLVNQLGASITLLKINASTQPDIQPDGQSVDQIKQNFGITDAQIVVRENMYVLEGIEAYCDEVHADLLIMSSRERSFIEEYITNPSVTRKLIIDTHLPLLVYHLK